MGGGKKAVSYVSNDYYNKMEIADKLGHTIHLVYLGVMTLILVFLSVKWYKAKKSTRERRFVIQIIIANYTLLLAALPDIFAKSTSLKYPNVFYCIAFAIIFFAWISTLRKRLSLDMSIKNVSEGIFYSIDVPIIIFSETGQISFYNPSAEKFLGLKDKDSKNITIKDIFTLSDVEEMRLLNKAKHGENYLLKISNDEIKKNCLLKCSVKLDDTGELYCIIGTILQDSQELNNEEGNL